MARRPMGLKSGEPFYQRDSEDMVEAIQLLRAGGSGFSIRQFTGGIVVDDDEPSTAEYQSALQTIYNNEEETPRVGDYLTLRESGGSRLIARFWILNDDQAATNATVAFTFDSETYYAVNVSYVPLEQIIDALQDYFAGANGGQDPDGRDIEPDTTAPFAISVNGIYDTDPNGTLIPPVGNPSIEVNTGNINLTDDITGVVATGQTFTTFPFPASDGKSYVQVYVTITVNLTGPQGTAASATATINAQSTSSTNVPTVSETSFPTATTAERSYNIGVVELKRAGDRRFVSISQMFSGDLKLYSNGTGSSTVDANGVNTSAGLREVIIVIDAIPYTTKILTGTLTEVT